MTTVESCKDAGRAALRQGDYIGAACHYTTALGVAAKGGTSGTHLLYGNRSECYLRAKSWDEALEDALKAVELEAGWAKGWYRAGQAAVGLERWADAYNYYLACLKCRDADEEAVGDKLAGVEDRAWHLKDVDLPVLGRCVVAGRAFAPGDSVLAETPIVHWKSTDAPTRAQVAAICEKHGVAAASAEVLLEVPHLTNYQSKVLASLSTPTIDLHNDSTLRWINCAAELAGSGLPFAASLARDPYNVARLLLCAKTNQHFCVLKEDGEEKGGIFRKASRLAHSCAPNLIYHYNKGAVRFTAARPIVQESLLSFSYRGELDFLAKSNWRRRLELNDLMLFWCGCERCQGPDHTRGMKCDCCPEGVRIPAGPYPPPASDLPQPAWECAACMRSFSASQLPLAAEERLETRVLQLDGEANAAKNKYTELKEALLDADTTLGTHHWTYGQLCKRIVAYFRAMAQASNSCVTAAQVAMAFGAHYLCFLSRTRLYIDTPLLVCHFSATLANTIPKEHLNQPIYQTEDEVVTFAQAQTALLTYALPLLKTVYSDEEKVVQTAAELWTGGASGGKALPPVPKHPRDPLKLLPSPPAVIGLFAQWESALVQLLSKGGCP
eukprot:TRINITY_DN16306_c0_g1_i1.p1 TRINITY_DN16306_c0_g1~~TRINITY_DN16306_c0_g1_i1.p1  ORF type:complete len:610 (+),score=200.98 TRINITY_DN16306_c0_g1_i1:78-1907(+)